jgi:transcriptional regulator with XRE-family HTH domain
VDIDDDQHIGRRIREIRSWRRLGLTATAQLAGMSPSYLSLIERGLRPVTKRATLEALAHALRVSPTELAGAPYAPSDPAGSDAHAAMAPLVDVLTGWAVGELPDTPAPRPWPLVAADLERLALVLRPRADYAAQGALLPTLIPELLAAADSTRRRPALVGLVHAYKAAAYAAHDLGLIGVPTLAVERMRQAADELDDPVWCSYVDYQRAQVLSGTNRIRQYNLAVTAAEGAPASRPEIRGMAHLTAAMAAAAQGQADTAEVHLTEAAALAELIEDDVSPWAQTNFGRTNVGIWRVSIGVELGQGARVAEAAAAVRPAGVSRSRQAAFWMDLGRGPLTERRTRERGLAALSQAEKLAPQKIRTNVLARDAVTALLGSARREAGGRDLRGLAWRMGVAPTG